MAEPFGSPTRPITMSKQNNEPPALGVAEGSAIRDVPEGCQEIPGFILDVFEGSAWLRIDGTVTDNWGERGVWPTEASARAALDQFFQSNAKAEPRGQQKDNL
jgi:hypothetical protein